MAKEKKLNIKVGVKGAKKTKQQISGVQKTMNSLGKKALAVGGSFFAAQGIVSGLNAVITASAKMEGVERGFNNLAKSAGFTSSTFEKLKKATDGTMNSMELMTQANNAMLLGIADSEDQLANMFDVAQRLAQALGKDAAFGVESLTTGLGRQSKLMLDNLGIMVKTEEAYEQYANDLGITVEQLTDQQRKQAFVNAAMNEAISLVSALGEEQLTTADAINQMKTAIGDAAVAIGDLLSPVVKAVAKSIKSFVESMNANRIKSFGVAFGGLATSIGLYNSAMLIAKARTIAFQATLIKTGWGALIVGAGLAIGKLLELTGVFGNVETNIEEMEKRYERLKSASWNEIFKKGGDEFKSRMKSAKESLQDTFIVSGNTLTALAHKVNEFGLESTRVQGMIAIMIKNGQMVRREADNEQIVSFANFVNKQREKLETMQQEKEMIERLKLEYPSLAEELGLFQETQETALQEWVLVYEAATNKVVNLTNEQRKSIDGQKKAFLSNMQTIASEFPGAEKAAKRFAQVQATVDAIASANAAYKAMAGIPIIGPALGIAAAAAALGAGYANVKKIEAAATGYDDIVNSPTMFLAGEAGAERVSVTPLEGPNINGPQGGNVNITFTGNVTSQDFIENDAIPQIKEAIRRGADIGIS